MYDDYFLIEESGTDYFKLNDNTYGKLGTAQLGEGTYSNKEELTANQMITDTGRQEIAKYLADDSGSPLTHFGMGTDSTAFAKTQTALGTEVGARQPFDSTDSSTSGRARFIATQLVGDSHWPRYLGNGEREVGLFTAVSSGTMYARRVISNLEMDTSKNYRFTWDLKVEDF